MRITVQGVSVRYASHPALVEAELSVEGGEIVALVGPNGAGKSTLLRTIAGTLQPEMGAVYLDLRNVQEIPLRQRAKMLAMVEQGAVPSFDLTVRELVELGRIPHANRFAPLGKEDEAAVEKALRLSGLGELASRRWSELSGGERQRALLAMAFAQEPRVLLLDEPTAHLDIAHQIELMQLITSWAEEGTTAIMALHDLNLAAAFAHRLVLLHRGRIVAQGQPSEVLTPARLKEVFGQEALVRMNPFTGKLFVQFLLDAKKPQRKTGRILLVGGGGSVEDLLPLLAQEYEVTLGVVSPLDSDYRAAQSLGVKVIAEAPFSPVSAAACAEFRRALEGAQVVVVGPTWFGRGNLVLLEILVEQGLGKPVLLVDAEGFASRDFTGGRASDLLHCLLDSGATPLATSALLAHLAGLDWPQTTDGDENAKAGQPRHGQKHPKVAAREIPQDPGEDVP